MAERSRTKLVMLRRGLEGGTGEQQSRFLERGSLELDTDWKPVLGLVLRAARSLGSLRDWRRR